MNEKSLKFMDKKESMFVEILCCLMMAIIFVFGIFIVLKFFVIFCFKMQWFLNHFINSIFLLTILK